MNYASPSGKIHKVWNSRDAITPFCLFIDGEECNHTYFASDQYLPYYIPNVGDYIIISNCDEMAHRNAVAYVDRSWDDPEWPLSQRWKTKDEAVQFFVRSWVDDWGGESPAMIKVTPEIKAIFAQISRANLKA